ncbi:MAG: hypothetical protein ACO3HT_10575, partial [Ilumatobacteraceae bacterium]
MPEKILVETEHLREQAQYTEGALNQVGNVILTIRRVKARFPTLDHLFDPIISDLMRFGEVLTSDKLELLREVAHLEQLEGQYPTGYDPSTYFAPTETTAAITETSTGSAQANEVWKDGWISEDGTIPAGRDSIAIEDEIGTMWRIIVNPPNVSADLLANEARRNANRRRDNAIDQGHNAIDEIEEVVAEVVEQVEDAIDEVVEQVEDTIDEVVEQVE